MTPVSARPQRPDMVLDLLRLHRVLSATPELSPTAPTNAAFEELVALATSTGDDEVEQQILADPHIRRIVPGLRSLCAAGEVELEHAWARRIVASRDPHRELRAFPYFGNYDHLTRLEYHTVLGITGYAPRRMLFVGSGPLPMTSLLLAIRHGHGEIDNIDVDPEAAWLATEVAGALGISGLRFRCADVRACTDVADYDMVCLAALVGSNSDDKSRVMAHLYQHMRPGALLLARSAHSLRTLLYPPLELRDLAGFRPLIVLDPYTDVVNSLVIAEKPGTSRPRTGHG